MPSPTLAQRMTALSGEGALDVFTRARALEAQGRTVVHLEIGEPNFETAEHIVEEGVRALREGDTHYGPPAGLPKLREAITATLNAAGIPAQPNEIVVTPGAKPAVFYAALATIQPGDEVLIPDPGFPINPSVTRFAGATPVSYGLRESDAFAIDVDEIASKITPRTRVLMINAPHNPTGGSVDIPTLERLAELAERHDLWVISDEIYARLIYDRSLDRAPSIASLPGLRERTIVIDGFSKAYAMTGWRLGYALLPARIVERVTTLAINGHTCVPAFVQRAGIAALTGTQAPRHAMIAEFAKRRERIVGALNEIPGVRCAYPAGAFYAFPDLSTPLAQAALTAQQFCDRVLEEYGVAILTGTAFGAAGANHVRISFAASPEAIELALTQLRRAIEELPVAVAS
jgi:aspartate aminotransferase